MKISKAKENKAETASAWGDSSLNSCMRPIGRNRTNLGTLLPRNDFEIRVLFMGYTTTIDWVINLFGKKVCSIPLLATSATAITMHNRQVSCSPAKTSFWHQQGSPTWTPPCRSDGCLNWVDLSRPPNQPNSSLRPSKPLFQPWANSSTNSN